MKIFILVLFGLVNLAGCQDDVEQSQSKFQPSKLALADKQADNEKLPELKMMKDDVESVVSSCYEFMNNISTKSIVETDVNYKAYAYYQPCIASYIFSKSQAANKSFYKGRFDGLIYNELDITSFLSSLRPSLDDKTHTFHDLKYKFTSTEYVVDFDSATWRYKFTLLARGDFNSDGVEDLLVEFLDESKTASYFADNTLVLVKTNENALWRAEEAEKYIKK